MDSGSYSLFMFNILYFKYFLTPLAAYLSHISLPTYSTSLYSEPEDRLTLSNKNLHVNANYSLTAVVGNDTINPNKYTNKGGVMSGIKVGDQFTNKYGEVATVVESSDPDNIFVIFADYNREQEVRFSPETIRGKTFRNPFRVSALGVGYLGVGEFETKAISDLTGRITNSKEYASWRRMLDRCYKPEHLTKNPTYIDCYVAPEWYNFQVFAGWFTNQYGYKEKDYELDKDILFKGNKVYSADTCCLIPSEINKILNKRKAVRGDLPIGVIRRGNKFEARLNRKAQKHSLGIYDTKEEAFMAYKKAKEDHIRSLVMGEYSHLPERTKQGLLDYRVEITD